MQSVLMVIAPSQFRDEEYARPKEVFERHGLEVITASVAPGPCRGRFGMMARAEAALIDVDPKDFDAVVFVGGAGASVFFDDHDAHRIAREMAEAGNVVAAICIAPSTLAHAGLLAGKTVTSFPSREEDLLAHGAVYTGNPVEIDGRFVTANGPEAAYEFGEAVVELLGVT